MTSIIDRATHRQDHTRRRPLRALRLTGLVTLLLCCAIGASAQEAMLKIDPLLRMRMRAEAKGDREAARLLGASDEPTLHLFVKGDPARLRALVEKHGGRIGSMATSIATARVPRAALHALAAEGAIERIEGARELTTDNDQAARFIGADSVWSPSAGSPEGRTGRGVIVGIVDTGIDWTHRDFRDPLDSNRSRIIAIWDQNIGGASPPESFDYGSLWRREAIEAALTLGDHSLVGHRDVEGHGTHVAGTAAGNGSASGRYGGMAPDAEIVAVGVYFRRSTALFDAVAFVFGEARRLGRPAVVNASLGFDDMPHDGNSLADEGIDELLAQSPGRVVCASAGNRGESMDHWGVTATDSAQWTWVRVDEPGKLSGRRLPLASLSCLVRESESEDLWLSVGLDSLVKEGGRLSPRLVRQTQWLRLDQLADAQSGAYTLRYRNGRVGGLVSIYTARINSREISVYLTIGDSLGETPSGSQPHPQGLDFFRIMIRGRGEAHFWRSEGDTVDFATLAGTPDTAYVPWNVGYVVRSPGSGRSVITVGAYNNLATLLNRHGRTHPTQPAGGVDGQLAAFSSAGPTLDGRLKPEIVAPGRGVISSLSQWARQGLVQMGLDSLIAAGDKHIAMSGTSMSTPVTTGAVALYLEKHPTATFLQVRERIIATARTDTFTESHGPLPNTHWGHGKLDIAAALRGTSSAPPTDGRREDAILVVVRPNISRGSVLVDVSPVRSGDVSIDLIDAGGRAVRSIAAVSITAPSTFTADLTGLPAGVYFVRATTATGVATATVTLVE